MSRPQLPASAIQTSPDEASLPTPIPGIWMFRVLQDDEKLFFSNGIGWIDVSQFIQGGAPVQSVNGQTGHVVVNTSTIDESTNLYWTQARFDTAFGLKSTSDLAEGSNLYYTVARFDTRLATKSTSNLVEGSNLYYTDARAQAALASSLALKANLSLVGANNGIASLDSSGKIPNAQLPALVITETFIVASQVAMLALVAQQGDVAIRSDLSKSFILSTNSPTTLVDWKELLTPTDAVLSVNGQTGAVSLSTTNVSEGSNLYYTTARVNTDFDTRLATKSTTNLSEGMNLYYTAARFNTAFAGKSTSDLTEGSNLYYTTARFDSRLSTKTTTDLTEGVNLYYTDERVDDRVAALIQNGTGLTWTYNDAANTLTGNITVASSPSTPSRTLNANFTPNATKATMVFYTIEITCILSLLGGQTGTVELRSDSAATPITARCAVRNANSGIIGLTNTQYSVVSYLVPAGHNVRLVSSGTAASITIVNQAEVTIG